MRARLYPWVRCVALLLLFSRVSAQVEGREWEAVADPAALEKFLQQFPEGSRAGSAGIPSRDGVKLAANIFLPPGPGPWPVLVQKSFYGRLTLTNAARPCGKGEFALVIQDARGSGDSKERGEFDPASFDVHVRDISDTLDWIAAQPWCNGRIGVSGGSGNGIAAYHAFLSGHPRLAAVSVHNSAPLADHWMHENGVRRGLASWMRHNGMDIRAWPRPQPAPAGPVDRIAALRAYRPHPQCVLFASAGWYDILGEAALEVYQAFADQARIRLDISPGWHAGETRIGDAAWPDFWKRAPGAPGFLEVLRGAPPPEGARLRFYLMGDPGNAAGEGNRWEESPVWPPPSRPLRLHLRADGGLSPHPAPQAERTEYLYDPRDPAPAIGGSGSYVIPVGPLDQRPLMDRADVRLFAGEPLAAPLTVAGPLRAVLFFSTDAPDTQFVLKVVDLHPDGRQTLLRETAVLARFAAGLDGRTPLRPHEIHRLEVNIGNTAKVLNRGHRIGLIVTSSALLRAGEKTQEVFEIHPNRFDPVAGPEESVPARQTLHFSSSHPTALLLPVWTPPAPSPPLPETP